MRDGLSCLVLKRNSSVREQNFIGFMLAMGIIKPSITMLRAELQVIIFKKIQREDGTIVDTQEEIKKAAVVYFNGFLGHEIENYRGPDVEELKKLLEFQCEEGDRDALSKEVTEDEIRKALFYMSSNKAPGPDGYTCEFFKAAWSIVGKDFVVAIKAFLILVFYRKV